MAEYIDRTEIFKGCSFIIPEKADAALTVQKLLEHINSMPAADVVELKHGKWYRHDKKIHGDTCYHCSVCEKMPLTDCGMVWELTPYCPFCGTKMDGGNNA